MGANIFYATAGGLLLSPLIPYGFFPYVSANLVYGLATGYVRFVWRK